MTTAYQTFNRAHVAFMDTARPSREQADQVLRLFAAWVSEFAEPTRAIGVIRRFRVPIDRRISEIKARHRRCPMPVMECVKSVKGRPL